MHPYPYNLFVFETFPRLDPAHRGDIPLPAIAGSIGLAWTHDRRDPNVRTGRVEGSVDENCDAIRDWGAAAVLSLTDFGVERAAMPLAAFARGIRERQMRFDHLPIPPRQLPGPEFEQGWREVGGLLRALVRQGNRIVIHAEGDVARSVMIIARLFKELGSNPRDAFEQLVSFLQFIYVDEEYARSIVAHAYAQEPVFDASCSGVSPDDIRDRATGALLGLAIGDAIGASVSHQSQNCLGNFTDLVGGGPFRLRPGEWTGNTAMALALADTLRDHDQFDDWSRRDQLIAQAKDQYTFNSRGNSLARGRRRHLIHQTVNGFYEDNAHLFERAMMERFTRWMTRGEFSCSGRCVGISEPMRQAILAWQRSGNPLAKPADPLTGGSSSLVRVAPIAIRYREDRRRLRSYAARQSYVTHGSRDAADACVAFADLIASAISGTPIGELLAKDGYHQRNTGTWPGEIHKYWPRRVAAVLEGSWQRTSQDEICTDGDAVQTLQAALWCIARSQSFEEALLTAANLGGDAAVVTAVTGQLAGAIYGAEAIPEGWRMKLAWRDRIVAHAEALLLPNSSM